MNKLEIEKQRAFAQGIRCASTFSGCIPGNPTGFQLGDVFTVPTKFEVMVDTIYNQFIFVETVAGEVRKFYPSQLSRRIHVFNEDGMTGQLLCANGSASQLYMSFGTIADGMDALRGKIIKVTKITPVLTMNPATNMSTYRNLYTFDLV